MTIKFAVADICTALHGKAIGSKVRTGAENVKLFHGLLKDAIERYDPSNDRAEGQHFVNLPPAANELVSCGVGRRTQNPEDYVIRVYREGPAMFLKRHFAVETKSVDCVIYTREAYLKDPDITEAEAERIERVTPGYTHVLVAVLAYGGPDPVVGPYRFVHNLAGGNHEYDLATIVDNRHDKMVWPPNATSYGIEQNRSALWRNEFANLVEKARATKAYADEWCTVAD